MISPGVGCLCWPTQVRSFGFQRRDRPGAAFEAHSSVSTWLLAIARYKAPSARRRPTDVELDEKIASRVAGPADDSEVVLQKNNRTELLRHSLARFRRSTARSSTSSTSTAVFIVAVATPTISMTSLTAGVAKPEPFLHRLIVESDHPLVAGENAATDLFALLGADLARSARSLRERA
jgi:hypothetical protein